MHGTEGHLGHQSLLTVVEVGDVLNVSRSTVYRLIRSGALPVVKLGDRTLVTPDDIATLIARNRRRSDPKDAA
jgi:excisionase family DNA binding protein